MGRDGRPFGEFDMADCARLANAWSRMPLGARRCRSTRSSRPIPLSMACGRRAM